NQLNGAPYGMKVVCEVLNPSAKRAEYEGRIIEVLGDPGNNDVAMLSILRQFGLSNVFPAAVTDEASRLPLSPTEEQIEEAILHGRKDLRNLQTITIDGEEAKDLDDAISISKLEKGCYRLWVHIADVSEYVKTGGAIDKCALKRATSVYFPDRVIPMLPFELADGLCSLVEGETRLTLSVFCEIDKGGNVLTTDFKKSFIKSKKRLTYNEVDRLFNVDESLRADLGEIAEKLFLMRDLSKLLKSRRREQGYIDLDVKESDVTVSGGELKVSLHESTAATELIEQFMITANEAVANLLFYQNIPCIYRIHEKPTNEKLLSLKAFAAALGVKLNLRKDECYPKDIQKFLIAAGDKETQALVNKTVLRCMAKAKYSTQNLGHFGLASKCYCHFTSPIRRYPDLNVHRVLKSVLDGEIMEKIDLYADFFIKAAEISSQKERNAEEAERAMDDLYKAAYLSKRVGEEFVGVISGVTSGGAFVALPNGCEVFCPIDLFPNGQYEFDKDAFSIKSARFDFRVGKSVGVKILGADLSERKAHAAFTDLRSVRRVKAKK
ncbi:MAG: VacB/RNase II family 3'-5' exoribonuclease, partial [Clostridia bacterium]|nr:VacB/RNase II family 3'-5' exoribonuclease [Clostridia bacterium]